MTQLLSRIRLRVWRLNWVQNLNNYKGKIIIGQLQTNNSTKLSRRSKILAIDNITITLIILNNQIGSSLIRMSIGLETISKTVVGNIPSKNTILTGNSMPIRIRETTRVTLSKILIMKKKIQKPKSLININRMCYPLQMATKVKLIHIKHSLCV